ncbi:unnamed protein product [Closterium sp. NIES-65]|nr:unnamed protein product [Closterium sp. NIES-65]
MTFENSQKLTEAAAGAPGRFRGEGGFGGNGEGMSRGSPSLGPYPHPGLNGGDPRLQGFSDPGGPFDQRVSSLEGSPFGRKSVEAGRGSPSRSSLSNWPYGANEGETDRGIGGGEGRGDSRLTLRGEQFPSAQQQQQQGGIMGAVTSNANGGAFNADELTLEQLTDPAAVAALEGPSSQQTIMDLLAAAGNAFAAPQLKASGLHQQQQQQYPQQEQQQQQQFQQHHQQQQQQQQQPQAQQGRAQATARKLFNDDMFPPLGSPSAPPPGKAGMSAQGSGGGTGRGAAGAEGDGAEGGAGVGKGAEDVRNSLEALAEDMKAFDLSGDPTGDSAEEAERKEQLMRTLTRVAGATYPSAQLFLYGSCANSFGVRNCDVDVCLALDGPDVSRVEALTHARVPIVKFMDPASGVACDMCVNNLAAVANSRLLADYGRLDERVRQLAFLVKHWAKRRQINETFRGTLSSYAYVIMCIHYLQQRQPPILPCLQEMQPHTYRVQVGGVVCSYYDKVDTLQGFGAANGETVGELLAGLFEYWAFRHDYNRCVISIRTGGFLSKEEKEWTRRVGNERHLICIEDPFDLAHDLGRVVDRASIRVLRDEFHRAAKLMRHDPEPYVTLFEPYVREDER